ncbi:hypothetical protein F8388_019641 [Cannabis sativa]|uniref:F-box domain-containing protein n=1 Tax=Cannabis sativa TaxID=3483 RepID=A0A7J6DUA9_CANSA|nr:hypothetical protein F8388_019641 [Cannabis sativa]KAF4350394.1 hypothetical protein G4B88_030912 [Cannabis sativa]
MVRLCDLPKEIIEKIMLGAPADSVFQFKFANKFWYSLISDFINNPEFVSKHLLIAKNHSSTSLLFNSRSPHADQRLITFPLLSINHDDVNKLGTMMLCNPALKEHTILPKPKNAKIKSPSPGIGFGLDPVTNEYKCVAIWCHYEGLKVEVYTLGSDSWTEINMPEDKMDDIIDDMMFDEELYNGLCCRGVYYWLVKNPSSGQDDNMIFSFNLSNEELQLLHVPDLETLGIDRRYWLHLSVWNDSVMMCLTTRSLIIHIFRMDEVEDGSWTKYAVKVGPMHNHQNVLPYWKNDEILMSIWKRDDMPNVKLVYYNIFTQEMRDVCDMDRSILDSPVCSYVKSLVSIRR